MTKVRQCSLEFSQWMAIACLLSLPCATGCGEGKALSSTTAKRLRGLAAAYMDFAAATGKGPANQRQLANHFAELPFMLQAADLSETALKDCFVSERDHQPFVVAYGLSVNDACCKSPPMLAYERTGSGGERLVVYANGKVKLVPGKKSQAQVAQLGNSR